MPPILALMAVSKVRLYVEHPLGPGQSVPLNQAQAHYLFSVMRLKADDALALFNGTNGEWRATIVNAAKREGLLRADERSAEQQYPPDLWLLFAPIKKARTDFIVEKATELGAARILPVQTEFTNSERIRQDRLQAHAIEAAEQCGGTFVPSVEPLQKLSKILDTWPDDRRLIFCDESLVGARQTLTHAPTAEKWAILIGPEGGFSEKERALLVSNPQVTQISLGPRVLRADTAVVAAIALWQSILGDWV